MGEANHSVDRDSPDDDSESDDWVSNFERNLMELMLSLQVENTSVHAV